MKSRSKIKKIAGGILIGLAAVLVGLLVFHRCKLAADMKFLQESGYYNLVQTDKYALNVVRLGNENTGHKIVVLSGMGGGFPIQMRKMTAKLEQDYTLIYAARAGWDASEDAADARTVETIVEDYRQVLKNSGIPAPYILMAHSMGGTYASYWVSRYPEEIEAFVNIDGTYVRQISDVQQPKPKSAFLLKTAVTFGIGDIILAFSPKDSSFSEEEQRLNNILNLQSLASDAAQTEAAFIDWNLNETWNILKETDVPKLYISARDGFQTKEDILKNSGLEQWALDYYAPNFTENTAEREEVACTNWLAECEENRTKELIPYLEKMGNCRLEYLPGDHFIYRTEPEQCGTLIYDFLNEICH